MRRLISFIIITLILSWAITPMVFAAEAVAEGGLTDAKLGYYGWAVLGCGLAIGLAALGTGIGMGIGLNGASGGVARNPNASGKILTTLIIGLAMVESLCIYALVVVLIVFFANPFGV